MTKILLTGATGYVGGRLVHRLVAAGYHVRCLVRRPTEFAYRNLPNIEIVRGDVSDPSTLVDAFSGVEQAFYLVHSMGAAGNFEKKDRESAENFAKAASKAGLKRIIYLGGLGDSSEKLSAHLRSRQDVGEALKSSGTPVIEFRASVIIGSGSLSFEMIRSLVERLPIMVTPKWVKTKSQPISISDVLSYLLKALDLPFETSRVYEIGGASVLSYGEMMEEYASQRGLKRHFISVPILTPRLSSLWLALITPVYAKVGRKLVESLKFPTVVKDAAALRDFEIRPVDAKTAIAKALVNEEREFAESHWSDAFSSAREDSHWGGERFGSKLVDARTILSPFSPHEAFEPIQLIGGQQGWYYGTWLWQLRGWMDLFSGGVGLRRGRRDRVSLRVGDSLDWWRVEVFEPGKLLRLRAQMKVPGRAWLEFEVLPEAGGSRINQTAVFEPKGLWGILYWYSIYPIHQILFRGMLRKIAKAPEPVSLLVDTKQQVTS